MNESQLCLMNYLIHRSAQSISSWLSLFPTPLWFSFSENVIKKLEIIQELAKVSKINQLTVRKASSPFSHIPSYPYFSLLFPFFFFSRAIMPKKKENNNSFGCSTPDLLLAAKRGRLAVSETGRERRRSEEM